MELLLGLRRVAAYDNNPVLKHLHLLFLFCVTFTSALALDPERIVVVANSKDSDSVKIAEHYLKARSIPKENLFLVECSKGETISWDDFVSTIFNPLRRELFKANWIEGSISEQKDADGRLNVASLGNRMDFLVVCRIPLRISNDKARLDRDKTDQLQAQFKVNQGAVDAELSLLAVPATPTIGFVPNPLFGQAKPSSLALQQVVKVARLDGPSMEDAMALVDRAIEAEEKGLRGRAYIDLGGPHQKGDEWIESAGKRLEALDYPSTWNRAPAAIGYKERFDAPAFYFGWWKADIQGPVKERNFEFPPGALGWHLHSFSATSIRMMHKRWTGPLVARGLTATVGNVYEPYLELTHRPQGFVEALVNGMSAGDAAYYALPVLSWMAIFVGDPLYQPFKVSLESQLESLDVTDDLSQYVVIREMNRLRLQEGKNLAFAYGKKEFHSAPGLALGFELAKLSSEDGDNAEAVKFLSMAAVVPRYSPDQQGLAFNVAEFLWGINEHELAFKIMKALSISGLPESAIRDYYPKGVQWAKSLRQRREAKEWSAELTAIKERDAAKKKK
ncbi:TIGR03790 family protein [Rubellicoccus peritrichatus]|uniref:TIGR03790 family protein n=1 Tax=Rubellicoccus peritrichatus TaxID=3080537 RepID=A0AAQ3LA71_9BACT|nr:TIGR03790 family protein [Puniceicoccus sp. CR14]WOO42125.1 TIGR03790 family protein [Puniceicoccus sp. CR14]